MKPTIEMLLAEGERLKELIYLKRALEAGMGDPEELEWCRKEIDRLTSKLRGILILEEESKWSK